MQTLQTLLGRIKAAWRALMHPELIDRVPALELQLHNALHDLAVETSRSAGLTTLVGETRRKVAEIQALMATHERKAGKLEEALSVAEQHLRAYQDGQTAVPPTTSVEKFLELVGSPQSVAVRDAVRKSALDKSWAKDDGANKRREALEWANVYAKERYNLPPLSAWDAAFLVEYWVGVSKGRI